MSTLRESILGEITNESLGDFIRALQEGEVEISPAYVDVEDPDKINKNESNMIAKYAHERILELLERISNG